MIETQSFDNPASRLARSFLTGAAFWLALAGLLAWQAGPNQPGPGFVLCAAAILCFAGAQSRRLPVRPLRWLVQRGLSERTLLIILALGLSGLATVGARAFALADKNSYMAVLLIWLFGIAAVCTAYIPAAWPALDWRGWLKQHRWEMGLLAAILLVGVGLRFYGLGTIPRVLSGDEGFMGLTAQATNRAPLNNPFFARANVGALYYQIIALALRTFGGTAFALRLVPALFGCLAVLATYGLGRRLFGPRVGLLGAALLAISHAHLHFSRIVAVPYTPGTFLIPLELYLFYSGLEDRNRLRLALSGVVLGFHFSIYLDAQIIGPLMLAYLAAALWLCRPLVRGTARPLAAFGLALIVTALPQAVHYGLYPDEFMARLNADGLLQSNWLAQQVASTGQPALQVMAGRVAHAFLALVQTPAIDFYGTPLPLLNPLTGSLFLLGIVLALRQTRDQRYLLINGYLWAVVLAVGLFALPPSADSYRMIMALPGALILAALGLDRLAMQFWPTRASWRGALSGSLLAAILVFNTQAYFVEFAGNCRYGGDQQTRFASILGGYLQTLDRETNVYVLSNAVLRFGTHDSTNFLSHNLAATNLDDPVNTLTPRAGIAVVAVPDRLDELRAWAQLHPGGQLHREYDCQNLMLLAYALPWNWRPDTAGN